MLLSFPLLHRKWDANQTAGNTSRSGHVDLSFGVKGFEQNTLETTALITVTFVLTFLM